MFPSTVAAHALWAGAPVFFPFFFVIPIFWILVIGIIVFAVSRRRHAWMRNGGQYGPWAPTRSAEAALAQRFAQGDIDEVEYRARLEVLRANAGPFPH